MRISDCTPHCILINSSVFVNGNLRELPLIHINPRTMPSGAVNVQTLNPTTTQALVPAAVMQDPSSSSTGPIRIDGSQEDVALAKSEYLTRSEVLKRRVRRVKQLARIYRDNYWTLMEELRKKYREYYWEYGKGPYLVDEEKGKVNSRRGNGAIVTAANVANGNLGVSGGSANCNFLSRCSMNGCKNKAMALTRFCHMHILSDSRQTLYRTCGYSLKGSTQGPILCNKPRMKSTVPPYCPLHFQKSEKHMVRALRKAGLNIMSTSKLAPPKFHVVVAEYVRQIQHMRRDAQKVNVGNEEMDEKSC